MFWTYTVCVLLALEALVAVANVGRPRAPIDGITAMFCVILAAILIVGLLFGK